MFVCKSEYYYLNLLYQHNNLGIKLDYRSCLIQIKVTVIRIQINEF
jgi:hypothetical protein